MRSAIVLALTLPLVGSVVWGQTQTCQPHVIIHRQALEGAPENTWAALKQAVLWGADQTVTLEIDLHATKDGRIIVFHDPFLDKSDEVFGASQEWLWEEINDVDFGSWYDRRFQAERMPLFEDVLEFCKLNGVRLTLDIKENVTTATVRTLLRKHNAEHVVYWAWVGGFGRLVGGQWKIMEFDGNRELIRRDIKQWLGDTIWVDDPRVLLDILHRDATKREVKMPPLSLDYLPEELDFDTLVQRVRTGGDPGRIAAARLRKHFQERASAALTDILTHDQASAEAKAIAARGLGRLADAPGMTKDAARAAEPLRAALVDSREELRVTAAYALGKLKDEASVARLVAILRDQQVTDKVRVEAARALGRIRSTRAIQPLMETAKEARARLGQWSLAERTKGLTTFKDGDRFVDTNTLYWALPQLPSACYRALGEIGGEQALEFLLAQYAEKQLEKDAVLETFFARVPALDAAARIGGSSVLAVANAHAWNPPNDTYMDYVLLTRNFPAQEVVPVLLDFLGHPKTFQRQKAFYALLRVGEPAVMPLIGLLNDKQANPLAREWAAWTLGWMSDDRAVAPLMNALNDPAASVRAKAAWSMGKMRVEDSAPRLQQLTKDTDPLVREYVAESLERLRSSNR